MGVRIVEGRLPHGSADREEVVAILLGASLDTQRDDKRGMAARDFIDSEEAEALCYLIGYPVEILRTRLVEAYEDPAHASRLAQRLDRCMQPSPDRPDGRA